MLRNYSFEGIDHDGSWSGLGGFLVASASPREYMDSEGLHYPMHGLLPNWAESAEAGGAQINNRTWILESPKLVPNLMARVRRSKGVCVWGGGSPHIFQPHHNPPQRTHLTQRTSPPHPPR